MKYFSFLIIAFLFMVGTKNRLYAQSEKKPLAIEDLRLWRTGSATLSDNGKWYTTLYKLYDEADFEEDTLLEKGVEDYFGEENQSDVLYIFSTEKGLKYKIPDGSKPVFSSSSEWIAYRVKPAKKDKEDDKEITAVELKHLTSGFTVRYESDAGYHFLEDKNYFITTDKSSLLVYDLNKRKEHYIGNLGEFLTDKKSPYIVYTIASEDKRGNGIYLYNPDKMTTRALYTGNFIYSNLSWNSSKDMLAAYKYSQDEDANESDVSILTLNGVSTENTELTEYSVKEIKGIPEGMTPAVNSTSANKITWSKDGDRLFIKLKNQNPVEEDNESDDNEKKSTVQIWHWKDKKLLSERIQEYEKNMNRVYDAVFSRRSNTLIQLTGEEIQELIISKGTDRWAIGTDNRSYISDWDVTKNDLYSINLQTGQKKLITKEYSSIYGLGVEISPDGTKAVFWNGKHYICYDFEKGTKSNISDIPNVSFVNKEYSKYGYISHYGFAGWLKDRKTVLVYHKHDLWLLSLDKNKEAKNLTASVTATDSIRFRLEDTSFASEDEIEDRYLDLSSPLLLYAYNTKTKYSGFYKLKEGKTPVKLIYEPATFYGQSRGYETIKAKNSDVIIYRKQDYQNCPEFYVSSPEFKASKKITDTNPHQKKYKWGNRILIDYTNNDGVPLQAVLSIPEDYTKGQKLPMIVHSYETFSWRMHRYPTPYLSGANTPEMLYVSDGYLFLQPDIHFNVGTPHSDMHECIDAAVKKVIELGYVDEKHIGYEGFSFGGHCGMYISTQENKFAAIAAGAGVSNLIQGFNIDIVRNGSNEQDYYMTGQGRMGTDPTSNTQMYISESAVFNAQTMNTPLLLFHGTDDRVVQWEHSFGFYSILRYLKKPVVFLSYRGEGHGLDKESNRLDIQKRLKEFFDHHLKGSEVKKWMSEETPYIPENGNDEDGNKSPKWR